MDGIDSTWRGGQTVGCGQERNRLAGLPGMTIVVSHGKHDRKGTITGINVRGVLRRRTAAVSEVPRPRYDAAICVTGGIGEINAQAGG